VKSPRAHVCHDAHHDTRHDTCHYAHHDTQHDARHDTHHDAEHMWTLKGEFRSKKSRNFFFTRYGQDSHDPLKNFPNLKELISFFWLTEFVVGLHLTMLK
jgi:hypothetical protein